MLKLARRLLLRGLSAILTKYFRAHLGLEVNVRDFRLTARGKLTFVRVLMFRNNIIINLDSVTLQISLIKILRRQTSLQAVSIGCGSVKFRSRKSERESKQSHMQVMKYLHLANRLASINFLRFVKRLPKSFEMERLHVITRNGDGYLISGKMESESFQIDIESKQRVKKIILRGNLCKDESSNIIDWKCQILRSSREPGIDFKDLLKMKGELVYGEPALRGYVEIQAHDLLISDGRLSPDPFVVNKLNLHVDFLKNDSSLTIERSSNFEFNSLSGSFFLNHLLKPNVFEIGARLNPCSFADLLNSFSGFYYRPLYSMEVRGDFSFSALLQFYVDRPYAYDFNLKVQNDLALVDRGEVNFDFLRSPFLYESSVDGNVEIVNLSPENPSFISIAEIPFVLRHAILCSEDARFYDHNGFDVRALGYAIITNLVNGRFVRGGSTITMQLVKNLLLRQDKHLYRKVEEMVLVWLIEVVFKVEKDRQLEIYLNIIELGPDIRGISEAAKFYFSKAPRELTLAESLVIAYVIPRPKFFVEALLGGSAQLVANLRKHFEICSSILLDNGLISQKEFEELEYVVDFANDLGSITLE